MRLNSRVRSLWIAHLVVGILCCGLYASMPRTPSLLNDLPLVTLVAIVLSQACLLGLWAAFSNAALWSRLFGLGLGTVYLQGLIGLVSPVEVLQWAAPTVSLGTAGVLLTSRGRGRELRRFTESPSRAAPEPWQFKIRGLMICTLVLALLFAGARGLREMNNPDLILTVVFGSYHVALGLAAAWAALGLAPPIKRLPVVLLLCPTLGTLFWYDVHSPGPDDYLTINLCLLMQAAVSFGSLLVVRFCGFRVIGPDPSGLESSGGIPGEGTERSLQTARPPSVRPDAKAVPMGIG
jgi:hypothetical protein